jgi:adenine-specific DNA methylase
MTSLNPRTRAIISNFIELTKEGARFEDIFKALCRKHNTSFYELKKIFKKELDVDLGKKQNMYERIHTTKKVEASGDMPVEITNIKEFERGL